MLYNPLNNIETENFVLTSDFFPEVKVRKQKERKTRIKDVFVLIMPRRLTLIECCHVDLFAVYFRNLF